MIRKVLNMLPVVLLVASLFFLIVVGIKNCSRPSAVESTAPRSR